MKIIQIQSLPFLFITIVDSLKKDTLRDVCLKKLVLTEGENGFLNFEAELDDPVLNEKDPPKITGKISIGASTTGEIYITDEDWAKIEEGKYWYGST